MTDSSLITQGQPLPGSASFGQALAAARQRQQLSQQTLAEAVGVKQSSVTQWERAATTPSNQHVFAVERVLKLQPGALARFLGFGPPIDAPSPNQQPPDVVDGILADQGLDEERRDLLIRLYRQLQKAPRSRQPASTTAAPHGRK